MKQPYVFRLFYSNENNVHHAHDQLLNMHVFSDHVRAGKEEHSKWKLIFVNDDVSKAISIIGKLATKPKLVEYFDPDDWQSDFKRVDLA